MSRDHIQQMGKDARAYAETQSWDSMMDEVIEIYANLIEHHVHKVMAV